MSYRLHVGFTLALCLGCDAGALSPKEAANATQPGHEATAKVESAPASAALTPATPSASSPVPPPSLGARIETEQNTVRVFEAVAPATVFVTQTKLMRQRWSARALEVPSGSGSGFIWDREGHVVTNAHVVAGARSLSVTLFDGSELSAKLAGFDRTKDIAVLKIESPQPLTPIALPAEDSTIEVGHKALAIGNPFGLDHTLTVGVISATGREVVGFGNLTIRDMLQTDAAINPGNSGGPLLNSSAQLIGMNTMIFSKSGSSAGVGFAVPVSTLRRVVPQIITHGKPLRAGLGVELVSDQLAERNGVKGAVILSVQKGGPADAAGLQGLTQQGYSDIILGDVIVQINEYPVHNYDSLFNALDRFNPGDTVEVTVMRNDKLEKKLPVTLMLLP